MLLNEAFVSVQGEGTNVGVPCSFIRTQGCNLRCSWCDTPGALSLQEGGYAATAFEIARTVAQTSPFQLVVITGGEPCLQDDLGELIEYLHGEGKLVAIETNATVWQECLKDVDLLTLSPKLASSGMKEDQRVNPYVLDKLLKLEVRTELKFVLKDAGDCEEMEAFLEKRFPLPYNLPMLVLQPEGGRPEAVRHLLNVWQPLAAQSDRIFSHFWVRILPQVHKMAGVR